MKRRSAIVCACLVLVLGCSKKASEEISSGTMEGSVYRNDYFKFSVTLPSDWSVQDSEAQARLQEEGAAAVAADDKSVKRMQRTAERQSVNLFQVFEHPVGSPVEFNPSITAVAERVQHMPGIKRGSDYLFHVKKLLQTSALTFSFPGDDGTENLGGCDFDVTPIDLVTSGQTVHQKYYALVTKGYALSLVISFSSEEDEAKLMDILRSVKFDN